MRFELSSKQCEYFPPSQKATITATTRRWAITFMLLVFSANKSRLNSRPAMFFLLMWLETDAKSLADFLLSERRSRSRNWINFCFVGIPYKRYFCFLLRPNDSYQLYVWRLTLATFRHLPRLSWIWFAGHKLRVSLIMKSAWFNELDLSFVRSGMLS